MAFYKLGDFLNDINTEKKNLLELDPEAEKDYSPFVINRVLGGFIELVPWIEDLNTRPFIPRKMQYDYLIHAVSKRKRFRKSPKSELDNRVKIIMEYYGYSLNQALSVVDLINSEQLDIIKQKLNKGG